MWFVCLQRLRYSCCFRPDDVMAPHCKEHMRVGDEDVVHRRCTHEGSNTRAIFDSLEYGVAFHCKEHKRAAYSHLQKAHYRDYETWTRLGTNQWWWLRLDSNKRLRPSSLTAAATKCMSRKTGTKKHRNLTNNTKNRELLLKFQVEVQSRRFEERKKKKKREKKNQIWTSVFFYVYDFSICLSRTRKNKIPIEHPLIKLSEQSAISSSFWKYFARTPFLFKFCPIQHKNCAR